MKRRIFLALVATMLLLMGVAFAKDHSWHYLCEMYGDVYEWKYTARDDRPHTYICWIKRTLPPKDVKPANQFRKTQFRCIGIDMKNERYRVYETIWLDKRDDEVYHDNGDSNWRPIKNDEIRELYKQLEHDFDRGYDEYHHRDHDRDHHGHHHRHRKGWSMYY